MESSRRRREPPAAPSVHEAAANVGARALGLVQTRIELAGVELAEARVRLVHSLLLLGAALGCALLALMVVTFGIVAWYWDDGPLHRHRRACRPLCRRRRAVASLRALGRTAPALFDATLAALRADAARCAAQVLAGSS